MAPKAVFADANVLVPIVCCDFILTAAEVGAVDVVVSKRVLDEVETNLIENFGAVDPGRLRRRVQDMRDFFADQIIGETSTVHEEWADVVNAKDRHVVAGVVAADADLLISNDRRLRAEVRNAQVAFAAVSSDEWGQMLWNEDSEAAMAVLERLISKRRRPVTRGQLADQLSSQFPTLAQVWLKAGG